jgi:hypothetical protein
MDKNKKKITLVQTTKDYKIYLHEWDDKDSLFCTQFVYVYNNG